MRRMAWLCYAAGRGAALVRAPSRAARGLAARAAADAWFSDAHRAALPRVDENRWERLEAAARELYEWNQRVNVVSRKDLDPSTLVERHYLPSLALLNVDGFADLAACRLVDVGTGGGFPGLPLAVCRPDLDFALVDSRKKKIAVVDACLDVAGAANARGVAGRAPEDLRGETYDVVLGRSVKNLPDFFRTVAPLLRDDGRAGALGGVLYVKGGALDDELEEAGVAPRASWSVADLLGGAVATDKVVLSFRAADVLRSVGR